MNEIVAYLPWVAAIASLGVSGTMLGISISIAKDATNKRGEIYQRIDDNRKEAEDKLVSKEVCGVTHKDLEKDIADIKNKTDCIPAIKAGVDLLLKKNGLKNG